MATEQQTEKTDNRFYREPPSEPQGLTRQLTQMDLMVEQAMRVDGLSGSERLALIDKIEGVYLRRRAEEAQEAFNKSMRDAQAQMEAIPAESLNPQTRSHYAKYVAVDKHIRPIYTENGFALSFKQGEGAPPDHMRLVCRLSHKGGHVEYPYLDLPVDGKGAKGGDVMTKTHATGAGVSYGKRYLAGMIFNLAFTEDKDDNDGNAIKPNVNESQAKILRDLYDRLSEATRLRVLTYLSTTYKQEIKSVDDIPSGRHKHAETTLARALNSEGDTQSDQKARVNDIQVTTLQEVIEGIGRTCKADFLTEFKIKKIGDLPAGKYADALKWLEQQRRK